MKDFAKVCIDLPDPSLQKQATDYVVASLIARRPRLKHARSLLFATLLISNLNTIRYLSVARGRSSGSAPSCGAKQPWFCESSTCSSICTTLILPHSLWTSPSCAFRCFSSLGQALHESSISYRCPVAMSHDNLCEEHERGTLGDLPKLRIPRKHSWSPGQRAQPNGQVDTRGVISLAYLRSACNLGSNAQSWCESTPVQ